MDFSGARLQNKSFDELYGAQPNFTESKAPLPLYQTGAEACLMER
jgi:hypothetical protein